MVLITTKSDGVTENPVVAKPTNQDAYTVQPGDEDSRRFWEVGSGIQFMLESQRI